MAGATGQDSAQCVALDPAFDASRGGLVCCRSPMRPPAVVQQMVAFQPPVELCDANGSCGERNWRCRAFRCRRCVFSRGRAGSSTARRRRTDPRYRDAVSGHRQAARTALVSGQPDRRGERPGGIPGPVSTGSNCAAPTASRSTRSSSQPARHCVEPLSGSKQAQPRRERTAGWWWWNRKKKRLPRIEAEIAGQLTQLQGARAASA